MSDRSEPLNNLIYKFNNNIITGIEMFEPREPKLCECKRCKFKWYSRVDEPAQCPFCKTYRWREERKRPPKETSDEDCGCNDSSTTPSFPLLCLLLYPLLRFTIFLIVIFGVIFHDIFFQNILDIFENIGITLNCFWYHP
jgi:hypothetical protein